MFRRKRGQQRSREEDGINHMVYRIGDIYNEYPEEIADFLHEARQNNQFALLSLTECPFCQKVKSLLRSLDLPFVVFEVDRDNPARPQINVGAKRKFMMLVHKMQAGRNPDVSFPELVTPEGVCVKHSDNIENWLENWLNNPKNSQDSM